MKRTHQIIQIILICIMIIIGFVTYNLLPEQVITHRNLAGEGDGRGSKLWLYILIPAATIGILLLMKWIPCFDPKKEKTNK